MNLRRVGMHVMNFDHDFEQLKAPFGNFNVLQTKFVQCTFEICRKIDVNVFLAASNVKF